MQLNTYVRYAPRDYELIVVVAKDRKHLLQRLKAEDDKETKDYAEVCKEQGGEPDPPLNTWRKKVKTFKLVTKPGLWAWDG